MNHKRQCKIKYLKILSLCWVTKLNTLLELKTERWLSSCFKTVYHLVVLCIWSDNVIFKSCLNVVIYRFMWGADKQDWVLVLLCVVACIWYCMLMPANVQEDWIRKSYASAPSSFVRTRCVPVGKEEVVLKSTVGGE